MKIQQESFTPTDGLMDEINKIADRELRSKSEMINILLHQAVKERNRKRKNAKEVHT